MVGFRSAALPLALITSFLMASVCALAAGPPSAAPPSAPPPSAAPPSTSAPSLEKRPQNATAVAGPAAPEKPAPEASRTLGMAVVPVGVPLRIQLDSGYPARVGTRVDGHLTFPIYSVDHLVIPANTHVSGIIRATHRVARRVLANAMLDGDFTPLATPEVTFDSMTLPDGSIVPIKTEAVERTAKVIHMTGGKKPSLVGMAKDQIRQRKQDAINTVTAPGKGDRVRRFVYGQLPYHPQRIWIGTQYDADLTAPLTIPDKTAPLPIVALGPEAPVGIVQARLTTGLTSATTRKGERVEAVLSKPLTDASGNNVLLAEGTRLIGSVQQVKPAAWFSRGGQLRFNFRNLEPVAGTPREAQATAVGGQSGAVHGQMTAAEATSDQNLSIDSEGGAKAGADKNKVLAPLLLGLLALSSSDGERNHEGDVGRNAVTSNGFGIVARVLTMATGNRNLASGFAYFALSKSIYRRWIAKGHETVFPRDTMLEIQLASR